MVAQKKSKSSKFLTVPTRPVPIDRDRSVAGLLEKMEGAGFGAKQLAEAHRIWLDMLDDNSTIYLCGSGNLIPSGMRRLLSYVIKNRFVDVIVMSGTVLYHDIHETLGRNHYQAHPSMSDEELDASDIARLGDTLANRVEYQEADEWIGSVINQLETSRAYSVREFLHLLGRELAEIAHEDGIMTAAYKARIPVYCPDILNSEMSVGIARARFEKKLQFTFDTTQDTLEIMQIAHEDGIMTAAYKARIPVYCPDILNSEMSVGIARARFEKKLQFTFDTTQDTLEIMQIAQKTRNSGVIALGSTSSQSMLNVAEIASYITRTTPRGHKYAISMATDAVPLTARTPSYSASHTDVFGKLHRGATTAFVPADPSIGLPMIITALSQTAAKFMKGRKRPNFSFSGKDLTIDVP